MKVKQRTEWCVRLGFYATHCLNWWGDGHECAVKHGHDFTVIATATAPPPGHPVVDLAKLRDAVREIADGLEGQHIPDLDAVDCASCEGIADHFYLRLSAKGYTISCVEIWEDNITGVRRFYSV